MVASATAAGGGYDGQRRVIGSLPVPPISGIKSDDDAHTATDDHRRARRLTTAT
jgi:hypothetical protein